jgi:hypothetical protein
VFITNNLASRVITWANQRVHALYWRCNEIVSRVT